MSTDEYASEDDGATPAHDQFAVEDLTCGPQAHGFGSTGDGRTFAFQVKRAGLRLEVYRAGLRSAVPGPEDVASVSELSVKDVDLEDERSVVALVRDALDEALKNERRPEQTTTIHAFLTRIGSIIDGI